MTPGKCKTAPRMQGRGGTAETAQATQGSEALSFFTFLTFPAVLGDHGARNPLLHCGAVGFTRPSGHGPHEVLQFFLGIRVPVEERLLIHLSRTIRETPG